VLRQRLSFKDGTLEGTAKYKVCISTTTKQGYTRARKKLLHSFPKWYARARHAELRRCNTERATLSVNLSGGESMLKLKTYGFTNLRVENMVDQLSFAVESRVVDLAPVARPPQRVV
jgi:hypothetical protein